MNIAGITVAANPAVWPYDGGDIPCDRTALINIDRQVDFAGAGGTLLSWLRAQRTR